jgi:hypothetical protein
MLQCSSQLIFVQRSNPIRRVGNRLTLAVDRTLVTARRGCVAAGPARFKRLMSKTADMLKLRALCGNLRSGRLPWLNTPPVMVWSLLRDAVVAESPLFDGQADD